MRAEPISFPSREQAALLMPNGRLAYSQVFKALTVYDDNDNIKQQYVRQAVGELHRAHEQGHLEPPLTEPMALAIEGLKVAIVDRYMGSHHPRHDFYIAETVLRAVYEYGYRGDVV